MKKRVNKLFGKRFFSVIYSNQALTLVSSRSFPSLPSSCKLVTSVVFLLIANALHLSGAHAASIDTWIIDKNEQDICVTHPYVAVPWENQHTHGQLLMVNPASTLMPDCMGSAGNIAGFAWEDFNFNGIKDANETFGIQGLTVQIFDEDGNQVGTNATTDIDGNWSIDVSASSSTTFRVEYTNLPSWASETGNGANGNTLVQFVADGECANLGVGDPARFITSTSNTSLYVSCFANGDPLGGGSSGMDDWFLGFPFGTSGGTAPTQTVNGTTIGSTFGQAFSQQSQKIFLGAFLRRYSGYGTLGSGGIYLLEPTATSFNVTEFYDLDDNGIRTRADETAMGTPAYGAGTSYQLSGPSQNIITYLGGNDPVSGQPIGLGVVGSNTDRGLDPDKSVGNNDPAAFDQVGKVGLGDVEISDDGKFLYVVNLYARSIVRLELDDPANPGSVTNTRVWNLDDIPNVPTCTDGILRPFALSYYRDKLYIGAVCSGENGTNTAMNSNLVAYVFELDDPKGMGTFASAPIVTQTLDYKKGRSRGSQGEVFPNNNWNTWTNDHSVINQGPGQVYPTPWLTDIEFTDYGNLVLNLGDRAGYQFGNDNRVLDGSNLSNYQLGGGMLFAERLANGTFQLESDGATTNFGVDAAIRINGEGPGSTMAPNGFNGGEFFSGAFFGNMINNQRFPPNPFMGNHPSTAMGSSVVVPGTDEVYITAMDPNELFSGGTLRLGATDGGKTIGSGYTIYSGGGSFSKSAGLGDLEASVERDVPIEVGNYVWEDSNNDGVQDPGEPAISGLTVELWASDGMGGFMMIASTTTVNGNYGFSSLASGSEPGVAYGVTGLQPNTDYELRFPTTSGMLNISTMPNNGGSDDGADLRDSDANASGVVAFTTGDAGRSNLNFDVGYSMSVSCELTDAMLDGVSCVDDNGTPNDDTDDEIQFTLNPQGSGLGASNTYNVTVSTGAITPTSGTYGSPTMFTLQDGSAGSGNTVTVTIADEDDANCTLDVDVSDPGSCSGAVVVPPGESACECTEYIYLNEVSNQGKVHKYAINEMTGALTEILVDLGGGNTQAWYPGTEAMSELPSPHGLGIDLNGLLYIGSAFDNPDASIRQLTCDGVITPEMDFDIDIPRGALNILTIGNTIYANIFTRDVPNGVLSDDRVISAFDACSGDLINTACLAGSSGGFLDWGFYYDSRTGFFYSTEESQAGSPLWRYTVDDFGTGVCVDPFITAGDGSPLMPGDRATPGNVLFGITTDEDGNIYIVDGRNMSPSRIIKYDATGAFVTASPVDMTDNDEMGWFSSRGIVYSETSQQLYVSTTSPKDDCVYRFDKDLMPLGFAVPPNGDLSQGNPDFGQAKGIAINVECCPTADDQIINLTQCINSSTDIIFLNDIFPCEGIICEAQWTPIGDAADIYDDCDQSITPTMAGCFTFERESDGLGTKQCGAFSQVLNLQIIVVPDISIGADQSLNCGVAPDPLTATIANADDIVRWEMNPTSCLAEDEWVTIDGTEGMATYDPGVLGSTTHFRAIVSGMGTADGDCPAGNCELPSNCVTLTYPDECYDLALVKTLDGAQDNPVDPGEDVTFIITVTNQGGVDAGEITITDYIPTGMSLSSAASNTTVGWMASGMNATLTITGPTVAEGSLDFPLVLTVDAGFTGTSLINNAEITADDGDDVDSDPGDNAGDPRDPDDDSTDDGNGDPTMQDPSDDDFDGEDIMVTQPMNYDLALVKEVDTDQATPVRPGDDVTYVITITNQGDINAGEITITDYIPDGMTLSDDDDNGWVSSGDDVTNTLTGPTIAEGSIMVELVLTLDEEFSGTSITNNAEITADSGDDIDSTPGDNGNDPPDPNDDSTVDGNDDPDMQDPSDDDYDPAEIAVCPADCGAFPWTGSAAGSGGGGISRPGTPSPTPSQEPGQQTSPALPPNEGRQ